ncbi:chitin-binding type-2 domain-containing protein [Caerostris darwini]|uniref:Chitin-binding type-2 domain-containing protein n=1 Tax=Caerostris darwini TaxID=1538125 RepID=A0AAV4NSD4_9ARAC|nr:chitin-binding type-2 domain-containing protein [Caerostris darwini]
MASKRGSRGVGGKKVGVHTSCGNLTVSSSQVRTIRKMKAVSILCIVLIGCLAVCSGMPKRAKRAAYDLPDGVNLLIQNLRSTFSCQGDGYYADVDNNCQVFHVCHGHEEGSPRQWSFACGNQTVFNQLTFTCSYPEEAIPCDKAPDFFYLNGNVQRGDPEVPFLNDQDVQNAAPFIPGYNDVSNRNADGRSG